MPPADVVISGGGVAGSNAATIPFGMGAKVTVLDRNPAVLEHLDERFGSQVVTEFASRSAIEKHLVSAALVIGAVLLKGAGPADVLRELFMLAGIGLAVMLLAVRQYRKRAA